MGAVVMVAFCCSIGLGVRILHKPLLARLMRGRDTPSTNPAPIDGEQQTTASSSTVQAATHRPPSANILSPPVATISPLPAGGNQPSPAGNSTPHTAAATLLPAAATLPLRAAAITPPAAAATPPLSPLSPHSPQAGTPRIAVSVATPLKVHLTPPATLLSEVPVSVMPASVTPATVLLASALPTSALPSSALPAFKLPAPELPKPALPAPPPTLPAPVAALPASASPATAPPVPLPALHATRVGTVAATYTYLVQNCAGVVMSRGLYVYPGRRCFPAGLPNCNLRVVAGSATDWHWPAPADRLAAVRLYTLADGKLCACIGEHSATFKPLVQSQAPCTGVPVRANIDGRRVRCFDQGDAVAAVFARALNVISARLVHVGYDSVGVGQGATVLAGMIRRHIRILVTPRFPAFGDADDAKRALVVAYNPDVLFEYAGGEIEQLHQLVPGSVIWSAGGALRVLSIKPMRHVPAALAGKPVYLLLASILGETHWTLTPRDSFGL